MLDLELDTVRTRGRVGKPILATVRRELTEEDYARLAEPRASAKPSALKRLSDRHHALARLLASGLNESEAAIITRYDVSRVSILKGDPAFQELIAFYRGRTDEIYFDMHQALAGLSADALNELRTRLEDQPEDFTVNALLEVMKTGADRTGFGPSSKQEVNVNVGIADRLEAARKRAKQRTLELKAEDVIDIE